MQISSHGPFSVFIPVFVRRG